MIPTFTALPHSLHHVNWASPTRQQQEFLFLAASLQYERMEVWKQSDSHSFLPQGRAEGEILTGPAVHLPLCDESFCRAAGWAVGWEQGVAASSPQPGQGARGGSPCSTAPTFCCYQPCLHQCSTREGPQVPHAHPWHGGLGSCSSGPQ